MSTNRSVGRITATSKNDRLTVAQENVRITATTKNDRSAATQENHRLTVTQENCRITATAEIGRLAATKENDRSAAPSKDRSRLCSFTFVDGRHCRMPLHAGHGLLCAFHAQKEAQALAAQHAGEDISYHLSGSYVSACDLNSALARLISAVAKGEIKPKTAATLAYLGQTLLQSIPIAQHEFINAFSPEAWRTTIRNSYLESQDHREPSPEPPPPPPPNSLPSE